MGFTTGLLGGFTLTTALIHLSLSIHARNRVAQSASLHQQSLVLNQLVDGPSLPLPPSAPRAVQAGVWETAKDRWNAELEGNVKKLQSTDWNGVRDQMEEGVSRLWRRAFQKGREGVVEVVGK
ncbi:hypothetical protein B0A55_10453 [Friedmanniomyces simplex]|uniref:MICOS complex subunit MIC12 n=1 Tax=Friedmanniomyces simplex TaxID=329884 RepID=A0A4V6WKU5_9PEZI|nr:hypothetical protein B0A55_10453 [Friedmanniomyces simplex]